MSTPSPTTAAVPRTEIPGGEHLPEAVRARNLTESQWRTLKNNLFPGATSESVLMVVDYCRARKLDPLKKPCHIVPMRVKDAQTGKYESRDVVMPGIYEIRTTAQRTGAYLGHAKPEYGPVGEQAGVKAPEWCDFVVYRWNAAAKMRAEYPVRTYFSEVVALKEGKANERWSKAPVQMLTKCAEAAALREAFPDELGGEHTAEEMWGRTEDYIDGETRVQPIGKAGVTMPQRKIAAPEPGQPAGTDRVDAGAQDGTEAPTAIANHDPNNGGPTEAEIRRQIEACGDEDSIVAALDLARGFPQEALGRLATAADARRRTLGTP